METTGTAREKRWRPADYPPPGPSWDQEPSQPDTEQAEVSHVGVPDAED